MMRAGLVFDPKREVMLLFGGFLGGVHDKTWIWDGERWKELTRKSSGRTQRER